MKKLFLILIALFLAGSSVFIACGDDDDTTTDDDNDDADDDSDDTTGDDTTGDDVTDDAADDSGDDVADDDAGCDTPSGEPVTLCNPVYDNTPDYSAAYIGWPIPMISINYDGAIQAGYQLVFDCSSYSTANVTIYPLSLSLAIYVGGADTGTINAAGFGLEDKQVGPFYELQTYTCQLYVIDSSVATVSNEVPITVTLGDKP